ncbi:MAG: lactam utilization protein LamB [Nitrospira sp. SCN 59-13]|nr:MAG: lactam utilization protein LamB [Nitrospira sp. SCN 59-13]
MHSIDLNCDVGEAATLEQRDVEARLMQYVTSVNIACGVHAGDAALMRSTIQLARRHDLAIGAHPGLPDRESCGRRELPLSQGFVLDLILSQVSALMAIGQEEGVRLSHVKPHGALYNMAARDPELADAVAAGIAQLNGRLIMIGLAGSELLTSGTAHGLAVAAEGFADRAYQADGRLVPRTEAHAVIHDESTILAHAHSLVHDGTVVAANGTMLYLHIDTLCLHGDTPDAVRLAQALRAMFAEDGVTVRRLDHAD